MPTELRYRFRFYDDVRRRWVTAGYRASKETIAGRYTRWETLGAGVEQVVGGDQARLTAGHLARGGRGD